MRKRIVLLLTLLFSIICLHTAAYAMEIVFPKGTNSQYVTGTGTEDDPYVFTASGNEENTFCFDGYEWLGNLSKIDIQAIDDSQKVVASYGVTMGSHGQKSAKFYTNIKTVPAEGIFKITAIPTSGLNRSCYVKLVLTNVDGVAGIDEIYDGEEKDGYIGTPKLSIPNSVIYDGIEHFTVTYQDADGKALESKPTEIGEYQVTFTVKDGEDYKPYRGSLTLPFSIIEEPQAKYQLKKGGTWIESSFREAVFCVYDGGTVRLLTDVPLEYGTVLLNKDMTITSNKSICTITSSTEGHGYLLQVGAEVTLENVIVDGGSKKGLTASRALFAIGDSSTSGKLTIGAGAILRNNKNATENGGGGGLVLFDGECILDGGEISGNSVYLGGGIYAKAGKVTMKDGKISNNTATNGGGIYAVGADLEINDGEISGNSCTNYGGGIYMRGGKWIFNDGEINENTAVCGGGVYLQKMGGTCEINDGEICDNTATQCGGAIYLNLNIELEINGGKITGNEAEKYYAGGIEVAPGCKLTFSGSPVIEKNTSPEETDGGVYYDYYLASGEAIFKMDEMGADAAISWKTYMESSLDTLSGKRLLMAVPIRSRDAITDYDLSKQHYDSEGYDLVLIDGEMYLVERVQAEKITIDPKELKMEVGEEETLTATLTPEDTTVPITWTSSNEKIATVDNGVVTAKKEGNVTITATIPNGESASCKVVVTEERGNISASSASKKYKITLMDSENGMVKASHKTAKKGTLITVMAIPDTDYVLHSLKVLDRDGRKITVVDNGDYTYSFQMPRSSVTVTVEFFGQDTEPADMDTMNAIILKINDRWAWVFGNVILNDVAPEIRNERTMLPIRFIVENLGGSVVWDMAEKKTVIVKDGNVIEIPIGQATAYVNGEEIELDSPAYIENDRTYLPLRFVAENLDAEVIWKADTQQVYIIPHEK